MSSTEKKIPNLHLVANIDREEMVAIVKSLGLEPDDTAAICIDSDSIVIKTRKGYRNIWVVDSWEVADE